MSTPSPKPTAPRFIWLRRRKGCLIVLFFLPFLVVFILSSDLFLSSTGYRDASKESLAIRKKFRDSRLVPRKKTVPTPNPEASPQAGVSPETTPGNPVVPPASDSETSAPAEEARFWGNTRMHLEWRQEIVYRHLLPFNLRRMEPGEWTTDPASNTPSVTPENAKAIGEENNRLHARRLKTWLSDLWVENRSLLPYRWRQERKLSNQKNEIRYLGDAGLIRKGIWTVQEMDRLERFLLEKRWDREEGPDLAFLFLEWNPGGSWGPYSPPHSLIYLILYRALENEETEKVSQILEGYVRLSGEFCFSADPLDHGQILMIETLERLLFWAASDRRVPEDVLEWTAATLASWKLTPQEAVELRLANLERWHDILSDSIPKPKMDPVPSVNPDHPVPSFLNIAFFRVPEKTLLNAGELLQHRVLDRKTAALLNQDETEYQKAFLTQWAIDKDYAIKTTSPLRRKSKQEIVDHYPIDSACLTLLLSDATDIDEYGRTLGKWNIRAAQLQNLANTWKGFFDRDHSQDDFHPGPVPSPRQATSAFETFSTPSDLYVDPFNDSLAMARLVFAAARYHREHGRSPDSVEAMIPRYLDESFRPTPDRFWALGHQEPLNRVVSNAPDEQGISEPDDTSWSRYYYQIPGEPTSLTQILVPYFKDPRNRNRLPSAPEDLKPYAKPDMDVATLAPYFIHTGEPLVFSLVFPNGLRKTRYFEALWEKYEQIRLSEKMSDQRIRNKLENNSVSDNGYQNIQLEKNEKLHLDTPFQILHILLPPWDPEEGRKVSPEPSDSTHPGKDSPKPDENPAGER
jgi:hypothetical protein